ncbi:MAG: hypothetical protein KBD00_04095 [Candidatus Peribacteraceae bacterium]|nr:hypothetical protein [Candidatus Peribacteraceae bacterium]
MPIPAGTTGDTVDEKPKGPPTKNTVNARKTSFMSSTQRFLPIAEIREDSLILKNGGIRAVLKVHALNFSLKSEVEQQGIISGYQSFVNTLTFPIQILIRSSRLNIDPYLKKLEEKSVAHTNPLLKSQAVDYAGFMEKLVNVAEIMQKSYYIIVPVDANVATKRGLLTRFIDWMSVDDTKAKALQRNRDFKNSGKVLRDRVTLIQSGLEGIGITMERLKTPELVQLFYQVYNPETSQKEKFSTLQDLNLEKSMLI